ncbi:MAG: RraA family protein [Candidatus Rokubacteria bacterium]|nr:RraA family protein [Candidatus Rokubacteria bacterium]
MTNQPLAERFSVLSTGNVGDALGRTGLCDPRIRSVTPGLSLAAPAFTVKTPAADNLTIHRAIELCPPGHALVIDGGGHPVTALVGDVMGFAARQRGIAGWVVDGPVRDVAGLRLLGFPTFAAGVHPGGPVKERFGRIGRPVVVGGVTVRPGDIVFGDDDGVVIVPVERLEEALSGAHAIVDKEARMRVALQQGKTTMELLGLADRLPAERDEGA